MKALLWDFDGTLAYRKGMWSGALYDVLQTYCPLPGIDRKTLSLYLQSGFPWHSPEVTHGVKGSDQWWTELHPIFANAFCGIGLDDTSAMKLASKVRDAYIEPSRWSVYDDVEETLAELTQSGWTHFIFSNNVPELSSIVSNLGLAHHFKEIITSAHVGFEKPNNNSFYRALSLIGRYDAAWMIGDSYGTDIKGAEEMGLPAILVRNSDPRAQHQTESLMNIERFVNPESVRTPVYLPDTLRAETHRFDTKRPEVHRFEAKQVDIQLSDGHLSESHASETHVSESTWLTNYVPPNRMLN
ncbi:HAD family hydrolase [Vibrio sp. RC27]